MAAIQDLQSEPCVGSSNGAARSVGTEAETDCTLAALVDGQLVLEPTLSRRASALSEDSIAESSTDSAHALSPVAIFRSANRPAMGHHPVQRTVTYRGGDSEDDEVDDDNFGLDAGPVYRSMSQCSEDDTMPVYRSMNPEAPVYRSESFADDGMSPSYVTNYSSIPRDKGEYSFFRQSHLFPAVERGGKACDTSADPSAAFFVPSRSSFFTDLPIDVIDAILLHLPAFPNLFIAMAVCRTWRDFARANYLARVITVPAKPDALVRAVCLARAGDTLRLEQGIHLLSSELTIDRPLRLLSDKEADALAPWAVAPLFAESSVASDVGDATVLVATLHVLLRTRCTAFVAGITLCRMGDEIGYPNAVTYAEAGKLRMERCRVTCGGSATSVPQALQAFDDAPEPGVVWLSHPPSGSGGDNGANSDTASGSVDVAAGSSSGAIASRSDLRSEQHSSSWSSAGASSSQEVAGADDSTIDASARLLPPLPSALPPPSVSGNPFHDERSHCPQSGVWVGAAASVELTGCVISACMGPGVKIYRGKLKARQNTIAFSSRGANVVANGGQILLQDNEIKGANGDGISSWHNSDMRIERNSIHANSGAGIAVNTGGGFVRISNNAVFDNACQNVLFATSQKEATMHDNDFEGSSARATGRTAARLTQP
mmetsp:Transcript_65068/g.128675  ORF Transcript_65068/g.128675 Transcript_65068/m.128675 type:complete len:658 (-) Transcript_65068:226-2199(-)